MTLTTGVLCEQVGQVGGFVFLALAAEEVGVVFGDVGALAVP